MGYTISSGPDDCCNGADSARHLYLLLGLLLGCSKELGSADVSSRTVRLKSPRYSYRAAS